MVTQLDLVGVWHRPQSLPASLAQRSLGGRRKTLLTARATLLSASLPQAPQTQKLLHLPVSPEEYKVATGVKYRKRVPGCIYLSENTKKMC